MTTLETLADEFPQYDEIVTKFKDSVLPPRLRQSLCLVYTILLRFLQSVILVFTKKSGGQFSFRLVNER